MKLALSALAQCGELDAVVIHSLDMCLYQASVRRHGEDVWIATEQGPLLTTRSLLAMQQQLASLQATVFLLRQQSAYDEMVGAAEKTDNTLEVPLQMPPLCG